MKPVKNTQKIIQYRGVCSGLIYTLQYFLPCGGTELLPSCKQSLCYNSCSAHVSFKYSNGDMYTSIFGTKGIEGWRIKDETN